MKQLICSKNMPFLIKTSFFFLEKWKVTVVPRVENRIDIF